MECPSCLRKFSDGEVEPHILIACGHSICKGCLDDKAENGGNEESMFIRVECPDCGTISQAESMNYFLKNFALVNMVRSSLSLRDDDQQFSIESPKISHQPKLDVLEGSGKHSKSM